MYKVSALLEAIIPRHRFCNSEWHWGRAREHGIMHNFREALGEICPPPCARWLIPRSLCSAVLCARDILESAAVTALISYAGGSHFVEHKVVPGIRSISPVILQIWDQIIFAFVSATRYRWKALASWFLLLSVRVGGGEGVQRCELSASSHNCDVAYGDAGLLMNIQGIINGNPPLIPPHRTRTIRQRPQTIEALSSSGEQFVLRKFNEESSRRAQVCWSK